ncbi:hypothetical protein MKX03_019451 [Papaver bracteatum]|nr:hypothetical protein MKX03_019451 [Papaver bracteatum]
MGGRAGDSEVVGMWINIGVVGGSFCDALIWIWFSYFFVRFQTRDQVGVSIKLNENCGQDFSGEATHALSEVIWLNLNCIFVIHYSISGSNNHGLLWFF